LPVSAKTRLTLSAKLTTIRKTIDFPILLQTKKMVFDRLFTLIDAKNSAKQ
jgi:hypothetical protein